MERGSPGIPRGDSRHRPPQTTPRHGPHMARPPSPGKRACVFPDNLRGRGRGRSACPQGQVAKQPAHPRRPVLRPRIRASRGLRQRLRDVRRGSAPGRPKGQGRTTPPCEGAQRMAAHRVGHRQAAAVLANDRRHLAFSLRIGPYRGLGLRARSRKTGRHDGDRCDVRRAPREEGVPRRARASRVLTGRPGGVGDPRP